jgi:hypothetical protein
MRGHLHACLLVLSGALLATACQRDTGPVDNADTTTVPADDPNSSTDPTTAPATPEPVIAPANPAVGDAPFATLDRNGDGALAMDELSPDEMLHQHFSQADGNGDGALSPAEVDAHRAAMAGAP